MGEPALSWAVVITIGLLVVIAVGDALSTSTVPAPALSWRTAGLAAAVVLTALILGTLVARPATTGGIVIDPPEPAPTLEPR